MNGQKNKTATATTVHFHFINFCLLILFSSENDNYALVIRTPPNPFRGVLINYVAKFFSSFTLTTLSTILTGNYTWQIVHIILATNKEMTV